MVIDFTKAHGQVRLLIADLDETAFTLSDEMVEGFLARYGVTFNGPVAPRGPISRAAADALSSIATSEALIGKVLRTADGQTTDGAKLADSLMKQAESLRTRAVAEDEEDGLDGGGYFGVVEFDPHRNSTAGEAAEYGWY